MAYEFRLPDLGEGLTEAEIARWLVAEGEEVREDQPLVEVQTDKTTVEIPSPRGGTVLKVLVGEGDVAPVGAVLVVIGEEGEQLLRAVETPESAGPEAETDSPLVSVVPPDLAGGGTRDARRAPHREGARRLADQRRRDRPRWTDRGRGRPRRSGRRGRRPAHPGARRSPHDRGAGDAGPSRGPRRSRSSRSAISAGSTWLGSCALSIHASAASLAEYPELNARLVGDEIVLFDRVDVGIAVQTDDGLIVPVVRGCERLSVDEIDAEVRRLADGARAGALSAEELRDSTFTVTSAGKLGGIFVTPLVNHPEVAILGLHRIAERPVVRDGEIVIRPVGNVSVSFDHRVVDGVRAAAFCLDVIDRLQSARRDAA